MILFNRLLYSSGAETLAKRSGGVLVNDISNDEPLVMKDITPKFEKMLRDGYQDLSNKCDLIVAGTPFLADKYSIDKSRFYLLPNSVDLKEIHSILKETPKKKKEIPYPIISFVGLDLDSDRIDMPLIKEVARKRTDWNFLLIGGGIPKEKQMKFPRNFHFTGLLKFPEMIRQLNRADVLLIPFSDSPLLKVAWPTKIPLYLSLKKPIVSKPLSSLSMDIQKVIRFGKTPQDFISLISDALKERNPKRYERVIENYRWESLIKKFVDTVQEKFLNT